VLKNNHSDVSRREFLTNVAGGAMLLGPAWLYARSDDIDPRVAQVLSTTIGIDMHNHVYPAGRNRIRSRGNRGLRISNGRLPSFRWQESSNRRG
jgi:hypothetical protein